MFEYLLGIGCIIVPALDFMYRQHKIKNRIEVDATVIKTEKPGLFFSDGRYYLVFQYIIDGQEYEIPMRIERSKYKRGDVVRIYCYNKNYNEIILPDRIKGSTLGNLGFAIAGVVLIFLRIFSI